MVPELKTPRLRLRAFCESDFDPIWSFFQTDAAQFLGTLHSKDALWNECLAEVALWSLRGYGGWSIELDDGRFIGQTAINQPPAFAEVELGYFIFPEFWGQGFAYEAALAAKNYAFETRKLDTLVGYIDRNNKRSIALSKRLGGVLDEKAKRHDEVDVVYRYKAAA